MTDLKMWEIEESGPLVRIDKHKLPDLDDLMLDVLTTPGIVDRNREIWEDAADDGEDRPTSIPDTDTWYLGEALVGFYRTNPCTCGEEHQFDMAEVPMDGDGQPLGAAARGAFLGVFFR